MYPQIYMFESLLKMLHHCRWWTLKINYKTYWTIFWTYLCKSKRKHDRPMLPILDPTIDQWEIAHWSFTPLRPPSHMMVMDMAVAEFYHTLSQLLQMSWMLTDVVPLMYGGPFRKKHGPYMALLGLYAPCVSDWYICLLLANNGGYGYGSIFGYSSPNMGHGWFLNIRKD